MHNYILRCFHDVKWPTNLLASKIMATFPSFQTLFLSLLPSIIFVIFICLKWISFVSNNRKNIPPSPRKLPIIGNFHQLGSSATRNLQVLSQKYGPLMLLHLGSTPTLVASSAEAAQEIMKTHDLSFCSRPSLIMPNILVYDSKGISFSPHGEYWRRLKSIVSYQKVREDEVAHMIRVLEESLGMTVNMRLVLASLTNNIISRVALGMKFEGIQHIDLLKRLLDMFIVFSIGTYIPWLSWVDRITGSIGRAEKIAKEFDEFLEEVIAEHVNKKKGEDGKSDGDGEDFVDILLDLQKDKTTGFTLTRDTLKAIILEAFGAGTETTQTSLEWALSELIKNPRVMNKLQQEVTKIAQGRSMISEEDLDKMPYLKAVIKESLRLHITVPLLVPRKSMKDVKVMGYDIATGTQVIINAWAIARDPALWEEPNEFRPERFLNNSINYQSPQFKWLPFGAGRRLCPGIQFSVVVMELALANIVYKFSMALPNGLKNEDLDMTEAFGITLRRKSSLLTVNIPEVSKSRTIGQPHWKNIHSQANLKAGPTHCLRPQTTAIFLSPLGNQPVEPEMMRLAMKQHLKLQARTDSELCLLVGAAHPIKLIDMSYSSKSLHRCRLLLRKTSVKVVFSNDNCKSFPTSVVPICMNCRLLRLHSSKNKKHKIPSNGHTLINGVASELRLKELTNYSYTSLSIEYFVFLHDISGGIGHSKSTNLLARKLMELISSLQTLPLPLFSCIILVIFICVIWISSNSNDRKNIPPSPRKLPIIGNFHQLGSSPHRNFQILSQKYGPVMLLHLGSIPTLVASSAEAAQEIMKTHDLSFCSRPSLIVPNIVLYGSKSISFAPYGEHWRQLKSLVVLKLLSNTRVKSYQKVRANEIDHMIKVLGESCGTSTNMGLMFASLTNNIISRIALGRKLDEPKYKHLVSSLLEAFTVLNVGSYIPWLSWVDRVIGSVGKAKKVAKEFDEFLERTIEEHVNKKMGVDSKTNGGEDFVDILLDLQEDNTSGFTLQRDPLKALILETFGAGTETTQITNIVYKFDMALPNGTKNEDLEMTEAFGITMHRKCPLLVLLTPRF
ncbi:hypothetical protein M8C21_027106 [Ambrosia artemisiifolia]|uniref:Cytochrome P450 n=1 Tax=Ambrosia artemisiifolia TaxID=4212 RepID=A0AAD5D0T0_AMBAR|nr:hypothetical protein M8C21_027106 [Ambrosia artemisiifolia]